MIALKYVGAGTYIHGVPARDLTETEAARHAATIQQQEELTGTALYEPVAPQPAAVSKRGKPAEGDGNA